MEKESMLWVYELKGNRPPDGVPEEDHAGTWPEPPYYYLFYGREALGPVEKWIGENPGFELHSQYRMPYEAWQDVAAGSFDVGAFEVRVETGPGEAPDERESTVPGILGSEDDPYFEKISLRIDPGVVFGSGVHPTTRGCLLALSELFLENRPRTVVDFGTGTGILGIACALMGAERVVAIDCIPHALRVASKNAALNNVSDRISFACADRLEVLGARPDLLLMNIEWPILERVLRGEEWRRARTVVLAGFLASRTEAAAKLAWPGFKVVRSFSHQGWPTLVLSQDPLRVYSAADQPPA